MAPPQDVAAAEALEKREAEGALTTTEAYLLAELADKDREIEKLWTALEERARRAATRKNGSRPRRGFRPRR